MCQLLEELTRYIRLSMQGIPILAKKGPSHWGPETFSAKGLWKSELQHIHFPTTQKVHCHVTILYILFPHILK